MIQNFKPYTVAKTLEPYTIRVPKVDAAGKPVMAADGKTPVMVDQSVDTQTIVQGPMASPDRDKDAGNERRRLHERECSPSV